MLIPFDVCGGECTDLTKSDNEQTDMMENVRENTILVMNQENRG